MRRCERSLRRGSVSTRDGDVSALHSSPFVSSCSCVDFEVFNDWNVLWQVAAGHNCSRMCFQLVALVGAFGEGLIAEGEPPDSLI